LLEIDAVRDYATVVLDGAVCGSLDRRTGAGELRLDAHPAGATLDILVENCGRINYGPLIGGERKGIERSVRYNGNELLGWQIFALPLDDLSALRFDGTALPAPAFFRNASAFGDARHV